MAWLVGEANFLSLHGDMRAKQRTPGFHLGTVSELPRGDKMRSEATQPRGISTAKMFAFLPTW